MQRSAFWLAMSAKGGHVSQNSWWNTTWDWWSYARNPRSWKTSSWNWWEHRGIRVNSLLTKELKELFRTRRVVILPAVFVGVGLMGPIFMRLLPFLLGDAGGSAAAAGITIDMPDPIPADGLQQYFGMARQFGLLAIILTFMGIVSGERRDGSLAFLFVKPISRVKYLLLRWSVN